MLVNKFSLKERTMSKTLKEQFGKKNKVINLKEKLKPINRKLLSNPDMRSIMIYEAFDKLQMKAALDILKKLKGIDFGAMTSLSQARDLAVRDVTKVLSGSKETGMIRRIVDLFKDDKENPLVDAMAFASALNNFFGVFAEYMDALPNASDEKTLGAIVTGKEEKDLSTSDIVGGLDNDRKKKLSELQNLILTGFKPEGDMIAKLGKSWIDKYLKGKKGMQQVAKDLLKMTLKDLKSIANSVTSSFQNINSVADAVAGAASQGATGSSSTTGTTAAGSTQSSDGTKSTKSGATASGAQTSEKGGVGDAGKSKIAKNISDRIRDLPGMKNADINALINALDDLDVLKEPG